MSAAADSPLDASAAQIRSLAEARVRAELAEADRLAPGSDAVSWRGALLAEIAFVKGLAGPAESAGGAACSGADGEALGKAAEALGYPPDSAFFTLSRPEPGLAAGRRAARLRLQLESVDARTIVALDAAAAEDLAAAFETPPLRFGAVATVLGRRLAAVDGFEASLSDEAAKRIAWRQLQAARAMGPVY